MTKIPIYILSLETRIDRQKRISSDLHRLQANFEFVYSRKKDNRNFSPLPLATQIEVAIWDSHVRAMNRLLSTTHEWALILEDDAILKEVTSRFMEETIPKFTSIFKDHFSILQIGWIPNSENSGFKASLAKIFLYVFRFNRFDLKSRIKYILRFGLLGSWKTSKELSILTQQKLVPLIGMRLGAHAYLINRGAAAALIQRFENRNRIQEFKTIDQDLLILTRTIKNGSAVNAIRFNVSLIGQLQEDSDNVNKTVY